MDTLQSLLPIIEMMVNKQSSMESTSITFEKAEQYMGAILYTIEVYNQAASSTKTDTTSLLPIDELSLRQQYELGVNQVLQLLKDCQILYGLIVDDFSDYRLRIYRETLIKGFPEFFKRYDPIYNPKDHLLTLDYMPMHLDTSKQGVVLIKDYLTWIHYEKSFLSLWSDPQIMDLLERVMPHYKTDYMDNICYRVLINTAACLMVGKSPSSLFITPEDAQKIQSDYGNHSESQIHELMGYLLDQLTTAYGLFATKGYEKAATYFMKQQTNLTTHFYYALKHKSLSRFLLVQL